MELPFSLKYQTLLFAHGTTEHKQYRCYEGANLTILRVVVHLRVCFTVSYRANIDGSSLSGVILKIVSFLIMSFIFVCDHRFSSHERCLYSTPKVFGIIMALIQLVSIILKTKKTIFSNNIRNGRQNEHSQVVCIPNHIHLTKMDDILVFGDNFVVVHITIKYNIVVNIKNARDQKHGF